MKQDGKETCQQVQLILRLQLLFDVTNIHTYKESENCQGKEYSKGHSRRYKDVYRRLEDANSCQGVGGTECKEEKRKIIYRDFSRYLGETEK